MTKSSNRSLGKARGAKQDEFYTQLSDISNELKHYKAQLRGKTIFCNCDDPYESNFFKHLAINFNELELKKLIATSYTGSPIAGSTLSLFCMPGLPTKENAAGQAAQEKVPCAIEINEVPNQNNDGAIDILDVEYLLEHDANTSKRLTGDKSYGAGDFRSQECIELLKQSDIVITNPPFSLFREYITQLVSYGKQFLIIGNKNAITYKECFSLIQSDNMRTGYRDINSDMWFEVPEGVEHEKIVDGKKLKHIMAIWLTSLEVDKHRETMPLYRRYTPVAYPKYDNYDAINVNKVTDIPVDYLGIMGVPITFVGKYNPEQFEILGMSGSAGYDSSIVGIPKIEQFKDARPLIDGKNTYVRVFIQRRTP